MTYIVKVEIKSHNCDKNYSYDISEIKWNKSHYYDVKKTKTIITVNICYNYEFKWFISQFGLNLIILTFYLTSYDLEFHNLS